MPRKRTRLVQKDQQMGQATTDGGSENNLQHGALVQRQKTNSFNVSGLLVGMTPLGAIDCDSVRSPTSPLEFKLFSNLGSSLRFPKSSHDIQQKCWDCNKVGLSIVDSLGGDDEGCDGKVIKSSNSKSILFGPQIRTKSPNSPTHLKFCESPKSLPKNYPIFPPTHSMNSNLQKGKSDVLFEIGEDPLEPDPFFKIQSFSLDSKQIGSYKHHLTNPKASFEIKSSCLAKGTAQVSSGSDKLLLGNSSSIATPSDSSNGFIGSLSASEIELSEDYTCVITHGPNPKTTHIFGDCILESHSGCRTDCGGNNREISVAEKCLDVPNPYPLKDFLSFCFFCKKKLEEGKDIYMYRGEKAFCSLDCRFEEIQIEEAKEKPVLETPPEESHQSKNGDQIFEMFVPV